MSVGVIIVAGGRGERIGGSVPKQLLEVGGKTLLQRSVAVFDTHPGVGVLVVVLPAELVSRASELIGPTARPCTVAAGGRSRQDSVANGFDALPDDVGIVLVHDAARPFVVAELVTRVMEAADAHGAAVPALRVRDTVKQVASTGFVQATIPRDEVRLAQTPQGFRRAVLASAVRLGQEGLEGTDEAMLAEAAGHPVFVVEGRMDNVKITTRDDLAAARGPFAAPSARVGLGYDLHRLADRRPLVLAGVVVSRDRGPVGHSDGDVICHAVVDAMLGAAGAGDIGTHFPDTDPVWKDVPGLDFVARAVAILGGLGWSVASIDVTVILERPKLQPHMLDIRTRLAATLGLDVDAVSVKAKTNEGVDAVGRGEAVAAHAVAVLGAARTGS